MERGRKTAAGRIGHESEPIPTGKTMFSYVPCFGVNRPSNPMADPSRGPDPPGLPPAVTERSDKHNPGLSYFLDPTAVTARCRTTKIRIMRPTTMVVHSAGTPKSEVSGSMMERTKAPITEPST